MVKVRPYEQRALYALEQQFKLSSEVIVGFAEDLASLARLFEEFVPSPGSEFRAGRVVVMGWTNHVHSLLNGGMQAILMGNAAVWSSCVRGLIETFGACVLITERPGTAPNFLEHVSAGQLNTAAERGKSGLAGDLKRLHQIAHPASGAIYAAATVTDAASKRAVFRFGLWPVEREDGVEAVIVLANLADLLVKKLADLATNEAVLSSGAVILDRD